MKDDHIAVFAGVTVNLITGAMAFALGSGIVLAISVSTVWGFAIGSLFYIRTVDESYFRAFDMRGRIVSGLGVAIMAPTAAWGMNLSPNVNGSVIGVTMYSLGAYLMGYNFSGLSSSFRNDAEAADSDDERAT
ncbi:hypothetical protein BRD20_01435 [Halobacteriales archaeon SW_8_65_20]|nr:MAG: hypothetical protein BRD20_01435 [Halobacteriales archaeon SW_8_65_20]